MNDLNYESNVILKKERSTCRFEKNMSYNVLVRIKGVDGELLEVN